MNIVCRRFHLSGILAELGYFLLLKRNFSHNSATKASNISIYFEILKSFLKSQSFQEIRASSTVSSDTNRADKVILNVVGVAM